MKVVSGCDSVKRRLALDALLVDLRDETKKTTATLKSALKAVQESIAPDDSDDDYTDDEGDDAVSLVPSSLGIPVPEAIVAKMGKLRVAGLESSDDEEALENKRPAV